MIESIRELMVETKATVVSKWEKVLEAILAGAGGWSGFGSPKYTDFRKTAMGGHKSTAFINQNTIRISFTSLQEKSFLDTMKYSRPAPQYEVGQGRVYIFNKQDLNDYRGKIGKVGHILQFGEEYKPQTTFASIRELMASSTLITARRRTQGPLYGDYETMGQLVQMEAESSGYHNHKDAESTPTLMRTVKKFDDAVENALDQWADKNAEYLEEDIYGGDLFDENGSYLVYMTLADHGVGIWDGSWDHFFKPATEQKAIKDLQRYLDHKLNRWVDSTGGGILNDAISEAARETAGPESDSQWHDPNWLAKHPMASIRDLMASIRR